MSIKLSFVNHKFSNNESLSLVNSQSNSVACKSIKLSTVARKTFGAKFSNSLMRVNVNHVFSNNESENKRH